MNGQNKLALKKVFPVFSSQFIEGSPAHTGGGDQQKHIQLEQSATSPADGVKSRRLDL